MLSVQGTQAGLRSRDAGLDVHPCFPWKMLEGSVIAEPLLDQGVSAWVFLINRLRDMCQVEVSTARSDEVTWAQLVTHCDLR